MMEGPFMMLTKLHEALRFQLMINCQFLMRSELREESQITQRPTLMPKSEQWAKPTIIGQDACTFCVSDVKRMALRLELDELTVVQPKGTTKFANPQEFAPLRKGGKSW